MYTKDLRLGLMIFLCATASSSALAKNDTTYIYQRSHEISEVMVRGGGAHRVNSSAFNATAVDTKQLRNTTLELSGVLDRMAGVKMRQDGGLGSALSINVGGFTGKHVKLFIDGVPMEGSGPSFSLSNIPVSLASRVEVYKGAIPVELGGDALGGAINIVTDHTPGTYVDASYSFGSFHTHRANLALGWRAENGITLRLNAHVNSSKNDYKVKTQWTDLQTNVISDDEAWFRRFHDHYDNEAVILEGGVTRKSWADQLLVGVTWSREKADIQNANLMTIVFGGKYRKSQAVAPTLRYEKKNLFVPRLNLSISARYDVSTTNNVDTLSRNYSWTGQWVQKDYQGEGIATLAEYKTKSLSAFATIRYSFASQHFITLNDTYVNYHRKTTNNAANAVQQSAATFMRRVNNKNSLGFSYRYISLSSWNAEAFLKYHFTHVVGPVNIATSGSAVYEEQSRDKNALGYGAAATYFLLDRHFQLKASYEKSYRLPTDRELFGDGDYEEGDATLRPEYCHNYNVNLMFDARFAHIHTLHADIGIGYRDINDYIIRTIGSKGTAVSSNHGTVRGLSADFNVHYYFKDRLSLGGNYTLQNLRDRERLNSIGAKSVTYGNRVPNQPYAFCNLDAALNFYDVVLSRSVLSIAWNMRYVHRFFRTWSGYGAKLYIPTQSSHDASVTYSMQNGRYNLAFEVTNIGDALLYDNYSLQKPGRAFNVKFRYVLWANKTA